jgi:hypothetical protein
MNKLLLIVAMILSFMTCSFAQNTISIHTNSTVSGDIGMFTIVIRSGVTVNGLNFVLRYDPRVIRPIRISPAGNASFLGGSSAALIGDEYISFLLYDNAGSRMLSSDSGTIFEVGYTVIDSIHDSTSTPLAFTEGMVADSNLQVMSVEYVDGSIPISPVVGVKGVPDAVPHVYRLDQNFPNPFNPATIIRYAIPVTGWASLRVYDLLGREVSTLVNELKQPGEYTVRWDASGLSSGVYFYRLQASNSTRTRKLILMK